MASDQKIQAYQRLAEAFFVMRENFRATAELTRKSDAEEKKKCVTQCGAEWNTSIIGYLDIRLNGGPAERN